MGDIFVDVGGGFVMPNGYGVLGLAGFYLTLNPKHKDFSFIKKTYKSEKRSVTGSLTSFVQSSPHVRYTITELHVSSSNRAIINSWWRSFATLSFTPDFDTVAYRDVRIVNEQEPYDQFAYIYLGQQYSGELVIETIGI